MFFETVRVSALFENRPDLLSRTVGLLYRRSFDVVSFSLGQTDRPEVARLTVVVKGHEAEGKRLEREMQRMIHTIRVDASRRPAVDRCHGLIKVGADTASRADIFQLCEVFRAQVIDVANDSMIIELAGEGAKINSFVEVLRPFGIVEMVRSGPMSLGRSDHVLDDTDRNEKTQMPSTWTEHRREIESTELN